MILQEIMQHPLWGNFIYSLAVVLLAFILQILLRWIIYQTKKRLTSKTETDVDDKILETIGKNSKKILFFLGLYFILQVNTEFFSPEILGILDGVFYVILFLVVFSLIFFVSDVLVNWYLEILAKRSDSKVFQEFGPLIQRLIKALVLLVGLTILFDHFAIDVKGIIVSLGVGSLALAFAAQDTLANMIAGFVIMIDRPFRKGDRIKLESGEVGDVYDIGLRSIKIIDFENTIHIIPNKEIANRKVINYSYPDAKIRVKINVGVAYGTDIQQVKEILIGTYRNHAEILEDPEPKAYFINMGDSSLDFMVVGRVESYTDQWRVSEELRTAIYNNLVEAGIDIPFPQRTLHVSDDTLDKLNKTVNRE